MDESHAGPTDTLNGLFNDESTFQMTALASANATQHQILNDLHNTNTDSFSSELSDALVIDESVPKKKKNTKSQQKKKRKKHVENGTDERIKNVKKNEANKDKITNVNREETDNHRKDDKIITHNSNDLIAKNTINSENTLNGEQSDTSPSLIKCDNPTNRIDSEQLQQYNLTHTNPYFNESLFELSQLHHQAAVVANDDRTFQQTSSQTVSAQFNCPKCLKSGFDSLILLQDHYFQCNMLHNEIKNNSLRSSPSIRSSLDRKNIFLCAACGVYYESWNLYKHMLENHKRYICLYCLGMFSISEDLCHHIKGKHNLEPGVKNTLEEFFNTYNEPCYVICCECNSQFNEKDNFFYHKCVPIRPVINNNKNKVKPIKLTINNTASGEKIVTKSKNSGGKRKKTKPNPVPPISTPLPVEPSFNNDENEFKQNENIQQTNDDDFNQVNTNSLQSNDNEDHLQVPPTDQQQEPVLSPPASTPVVDTRKVPKLSLKLIKKSDTYQREIDSDNDGERHFSAMEIDENAESENEENTSDLDQSKDQTEPQNDTSIEEENNDKKQTIKEPMDIVAGPEVPILEIQLDQPLDKMEIKSLVQKCLRATVPTCIYCNHSRRIAVNGKQLGLHAIAEHRYSAINQSITAEELIPESFNTKIRQCLDELENVYFNLESGSSSEAITYSHVFECFQCHYSTTVHKELYLHNRKFHSKNVLLCIMCKSNFYSYSELLCHLCPGIYVLDFILQFRCCMCVTDDLPSSFRLMVHMRKKHNACDVCLEMCNTQYKLSNHVWKHKLHHFCYRCGIAYRNKPDITRHLFWKHGTESVLCKRCLQKKWPHVYHFCVPPASFTCDECNLIFTRAVSLKVHKRLHTNEKKHQCTWDGEDPCTEAFISKKLMLKHLKYHTDPPPPPPTPPPLPPQIERTENSDETMDISKQDAEEQKNEAELTKAAPVKPKMDVCDLPELNLSESDSSDSENEEKVEKPKEEEEKFGIKSKTEVPANIFDGKQQLSLNTEEIEAKPTEQQQPQEMQIDDNSVMQNIWDNFKTYQANKEKMDHIFSGDIEMKGNNDKPYVPDIPIPIIEVEKKKDVLTLEDALRDHDYCGNRNHPADTIVEIEPALESAERVDHDYCFQSHPASDKNKEERSRVENETNMETVAQADPPSLHAQKKPGSSSSSSSDSDSSCACGSSCSCSDSSSDSSSSSSDSSNSDSSTVEGRKKQQERRLKRKTKTRATKRTESTNTVIDVVNLISNDQQQAAATAPTAGGIGTAEMPICESDLETTESETDEEFYDREPLKFAKKLLEERRAQLLADAGTNNDVPTANGGFIESSSRPPTPPEGAVVDEDVRKKKKKTKKRKKKKSEKRHAAEERTYSATLIIPKTAELTGHEQTHAMAAEISATSAYYHHQQNSPTVAPLTLSLSRINSPALPQVLPQQTNLETPTLNRQISTTSDQSSLRASKRKRVPNKFYGYSSEEEGENKQPGMKKCKTDTNKSLSTSSSQSPKLMPPITLRISRPRAPTPPPPPPPQQPPTPSYNYTPEKSFIPPLRLSRPPPQPPAKLCQNDSGTDSDSDVDTGLGFSPAKLEPLLYCYCRCPYDEVSEMIGCDSSDCKIEWFHFECVGIMVPPKGQWFCPDCRKKKQQQQMQQQQQYNREIFT